MDWFLYGNDLRHERVKLPKNSNIILICVYVKCKRCVVRKLTICGVEIEFDYLNKWLQVITSSWKDVVLLQTNAKLIYEGGNVIEVKMKGSRSICEVC